MSQHNVNWNVRCVAAGGKTRLRSLSDEYELTLYRYTVCNRGPKERARCIGSSHLRRVRSTGLIGSVAGLVSGSVAWSRWMESRRDLLLCFAIAVARAQTRTTQWLTIITVAPARLCPCTSDTAHRACNKWKCPRLALRVTYFPANQVYVSHSAHAYRTHTEPGISFYLLRHRHHTHTTVCMIEYVGRREGISISPCPTDPVNIIAIQTRDTIMKWRRTGFYARPSTTAPAA